MRILGTLLLSAAASAAVVSNENNAPVTDQVTIEQPELLSENPERELPPWGYGWGRGLYGRGYGYGGYGGYGRGFGYYPYGGYGMRGYGMRGYGRYW